MILTSMTFVCLCENIDIGRKRKKKVNRKQQDEHFVFGHEKAVSFQELQTQS